MAITFNHNDQVYVKDGNLGIGTASPNRPLNIETNTTDVIGALKIKNAGTGDASMFFTVNASGTVWQLGIDNSDGDKFKIGQDNSNADVGVGTKLTIDTSGNVGIGTTSPSRILHVRKDNHNGIGAVLRLENNTGGGDNKVGILLTDGTYNSWIKGGRYDSETKSFLSFETTDSEAVRIDGDGNVGVGTASPAYKLDVRVSAAGNYAYFGASSDGGQRGLVFTSADNGIFLGAIHTINASSGSGIIALATGGNERMRITSGGNVGIGTTSPASKLHISDGFIRVDASSNAQGVEIYGRSSDNIGELNFRTNSGVFLGRVDGRNDGLGIWSSSGLPINFKPGNTGTKVTFQNNGNVGIGTTSPVTGLDVRKASYSNTTARFGDNGPVYIVNDWPIIGFNTYYDGAWKYGGTADGKYGGAIEFDYNNGHFYIGRSTSTGNVGDTLSKSQALTILNDGNVGIGTTSPSYKLHVEGGHIGVGPQYAIKARYDDNENYHSSLRWANLQLGNNGRNRIIAGRTGAGGYLEFWVNNTNDASVYSTTPDGNFAMRIASDGNVGIGTTSPSHTLTVAGDGLRSYGTISSISNGALLGRYSGGTGIDSGELILATDAKTGWDEDVDEFGRIRFYSTDSSGIGARDAAVIKAVNGFGDGSNTVTFSGELAFFTSAYNANVAEAVRIDSSGNVGIGTTSPGGRLELNGSGQSWSTAPAIRMWDSYNSKGWLVGNVNNITAGDFYIRTLPGEDTNPGTSNNEFTIKHATGNVGIGTTSPGAKLEVNGDGSVDIIRARYNSGYYTDYSSNKLNFTGTSQTYQIQNNGSAVITIDASSNVGIGTTSPGGKLDIRKAQSTTAFTSPFLKLFPSATTNTTGLTSITLGTSPVDNYGVSLSGWRYGTDGTPKFIIKMHNNSASGLDALTVDSSGNVGIGTTSPTYKLDVNGGMRTSSVTGPGVLDLVAPTSFLRFQANANNIFYDAGGTHFFRTASGASTSMVITSAGNVGIGTTAPQQALHIKGATNALMMLEGDNDNGIAGCYYKAEDTDDTMNRTKGFFGFTGNNIYGNGYFTMWLDNANDDGTVTASEERFRWERDGDFHADGDVIAYSTTTPSDIRLKTDVETIESASEKVSKLRGVEYTWSKGKLAGQREIGLIAQEVEAVVPEVVKEKELPLWDDSGESYKTVDYEKLVALLIESNKELQARVEQLENKLYGFTK